MYIITTIPCYLSFVGDKANSISLKLPIGSEILKIKRTTSYKLDVIVKLNYSVKQEIEYVLTFFKDDEEIPDSNKYINSFKTMYKDIFHACLIEN